MARLAWWREQPAAQKPFHSSRSPSQLSCPRSQSSSQGLGRATDDRPRFSARHEPTSQPQYLHHTHRPSHSAAGRAHHQKMSRLTAVVLSLLALSCSALKVPFAGRKVDARVTSPFVDFVGPNVDDAAESLRARFSRRRWSSATRGGGDLRPLPRRDVPQDEAGAVTHLDSLPPMRMAHEPELTTSSTRSSDRAVQHITAASLATPSLAAPPSARQRIRCFLCVYVCRWMIGLRAAARARRLAQGCARSSQELRLGLPSPD